MVKKNLTRKVLSNKIYQELGYSKNFSSKLIDNLFENLVVELIKNDKIKISTFGTFKVISKKQRIGRNPKTKVEVKIKPRKVVTFKSSILLKEKLNQQ
jgi:integration host factor subunit alpha